LTSRPRYGSGEAGSLWIILFCWPKVFTEMVPSDGNQFARCAYTIETFWSVEEVDVVENTLLRNLEPRESVRIPRHYINGGHA
jgi:hypothetical protein